MPMSASPSLFLRRELDVSSMISALQTQPTDFEFSRGTLLHVPSRHRYQFSRNGRISIEAECGCSMLAIRQDQLADLGLAFQSWRENYWQIIETNREFASHFKQPNAFVRLIRDIHMAWRRFRRKETSVTLTASTPSMALPYTDI